MTQKEDEQLVALKAQGLTYKEISQQMAIPENTINKRFLLLKKKGLSTPVDLAIASTPITKPILGISETDLRRKHDMFYIILAFVKKIQIGKFIEESQMLKEVGLYGKPRYRDAISRVELKDYKGKVDGTTYYGHSESIQKLKNEGVLS